MMKYLREYEEEEIKSLMGDLEAIGHKNLIGWVVMKNYSPSSYFHPRNPAGVEKYLTNFYVVGAHSFEEAIEIFHKNAFPDPNYQSWYTPDSDEEKLNIRKLIKNERDFLTLWVTGYSKRKDPIDADLVSGLKGKGGKPFFAKLDSENPFAIVSFLNEKFTNAEEAFTKKFGYGPGFTMEYKEL